MGEVTSETILCRQSQVEKSNIKPLFPQNKKAPATTTQQISKNDDDFQDRHIQKEGQIH